MKKIIIGLGPGRCGSKSFVTLMNLQRGVECYHEFARLPWEVDVRRMNRYFDAFDLYERTSYLGDCGNWYINYIDQMISRFEGHVKFVHLHRPRAQVVRSYMNKVKHGNHWTAVTSKCRTGEEKWSQFDECYPNYDYPKEEAIGLYYDDYELLVSRAVKKYHKQVRVFNLDVFTKEMVQRELFYYLGIDKPHICLGVQENRGYNLKTFIGLMDARMEEGKK